MAANHIAKPDELALAICFDVLTSVEEMTLSAISSLLYPWGWTRDALVDQLQQLQGRGLLIIVGADDSTSPPWKRNSPATMVRITPAGREVSDRHGLGSYRRNQDKTSSRNSKMVGKTTGRTQTAKTQTEAV